jgi:hypothetical protein
VKKHTVRTWRARQTDDPTHPLHTWTGYVVGNLPPAVDNPPRKVGKPLREPLAPLFAARRGEYRVIYRVSDQGLVIEVISGIHRRDAYHS